MVTQTDLSYKFNIQCYHFYSVLNSTGWLHSISDLLYNLLSKITHACFLKECTVLKTAMPSTVIKSVIYLNTWLSQHSRKLVIIIKLWVPTISFSPGCTIGWSPITLHNLLQKPKLTVPTFFLALIISPDYYLVINSLLFWEISLIFIISNLCSVWLLILGKSYLVSLDKS